MTSAMLLKDLICGIENEYAEVFRPSRFSAEEIPERRVIRIWYPDSVS